MKLNELKNLKRSIAMVEGETYKLLDLTYRRVEQNGDWKIDSPDGKRGCITCNTDKGYSVYLPNTIVRAYEEMANDGATMDECARLLIGHTVKCVRVSYKRKSFLTLQWLDE